VPEGELDGVSEPEGEPDWDEGDPDCGLVDTGGWAWPAGLFWKISTTISKARVARRIISSQLTRMVTQPARS
jgi:hypothetical protein